MQKTLLALLGNVIDYGLPPSSPIEQSIQNYAGYIGGLEGWIVNRLVCYPESLDMLASFLKSTSMPLENEFWPLTYLGGPFSEFDKGLERIKEFSELTDKARFLAYELQAPEGELDSKLLLKYANKLAPYSDFNNEVYIELSWDQHLMDNIHCLADTEIFCAKVRLDDVAAATPEPALVAEFIQECINLGMGFKFAGGLDHPLYKKDLSDTKLTYGFLNILVACLFIEVHDFTQKEITEILTDTDADSFKFDEQELAWKDLKTNLESIESFREIFVSYESCSVEESLKGLRKLNFLV